MKFFFFLIKPARLYEQSSIQKFKRHEFLRETQTIPSLIKFNLEQTSRSLAQLDQKHEKQINKPSQYVFGPKTKKWLKGVLESHSQTPLVLEKLSFYKKGMRFSLSFSSRQYNKTLRKMRTKDEKSLIFLVR